MIQIFLDNKQVQPTAASSIKVTAENPLYLTGSEYAFEIEFPIDIPENRAVFGNITRIDVSKQSTSFAARIMSDNRLILSGQAVITQVSEQSVKIQVLSTVAYAVYASKEQTAYIDELDIDSVCKDDHAAGLVMYPVYNTTADVVVNYCGIMYDSNDSSYKPVYNDMLMPTEEGKENPLLESWQPFVWLIAKKIAKACGYNLADKDNALKQDDLLGRIFIVNGSGSPYLKSCLPHWTVNEWWNEVRKAFGVVLSIDNTTRTARLENVDSHFADNDSFVFIDNVVDEYTADLDDDTNDDVSVCNTKFADHDSDNVALLSDDVIAAARYNDDFASIAAIREHLSTVSDSQMWINSNLDTIFRCKDGRQFIIFNDMLGAPCISEVNQFRTRIINDDEDSAESEIKFVPCPLKEYIVKVYKQIPLGTGIKIDDYIIGSASPKVLTRPDRGDAKKWARNIVVSAAATLEGIIKGEDSAPDKGEPEGVVYMGIHSTTGYDSVHFDLKDQISNLTCVQYPMPQIPYSRAWLQLNDLVYFDGNGYSLGLCKVDNVKNLYTKSIARSSKIDTRVRYCVKFITDSIPSPSSVYLIHNKKYICEKIEATFQTDGMDKMVTGYFYELRS